MKMTRTKTAKTHTCKLLSVAALLAVAAQANAATITGVSINDFSSEFSTTRGVGKTIDLSGLGTYTPGGTTTHSTATADMWTPNNGDFSDGGVFVEFDLGDNYNLSFFDVWNYNGDGGANLSSRGAKDVTISVASSLGGSLTSLGGFVFDQAPDPNSSTTAFGQTVDLSSFTAADNVRVIRFDITTVYTPSGGDFRFSGGLSEVRFDGALVPEPGSLALMGLGGLCLLRRRRNA